MVGPPMSYAVLLLMRGTIKNKEDYGKRRELVVIEGDTGFSKCLLFVSGGKLLIPLST